MQPCFRLDSASTTGARPLQSGTRPYNSAVGVMTAPGTGPNPTTAVALVLRHGRFKRTRSMSQAPMGLDGATIAPPIVTKQELADPAVPALNVEWTAPRTLAQVRTYKLKGEGGDGQAKTLWDVGDDRKPTPPRRTSWRRNSSPRKSRANLSAFQPSHSRYTHFPRLVCVVGTSLSCCAASPTW